MRRALLLAVVLALGAPLRAGDEEGLLEHSGWAVAASAGGKTAWGESGAAPRSHVGTGPEERRQGIRTPPPPPPPPAPHMAVKTPEPARPQPPIAPPVEADFFEHSGFLPSSGPKPGWLGGARPPSRRWRS